MRGSNLVMLLAVAASLVVRPAAAAEPVKQSADTSVKIRPAIVSVIAYDAAGKQLAKGNGVIIKENGVVATCWHLISRAAKIKVVRPTDGAWTVDSLIAWDTANDFAILKVPAPRALPALPLGDSSGVNKGSKLLLTSIASAPEPIAVEGTVSAICVLPRAPRLIEVSANVPAESVGSPVLDSQGQVVGLTAFVHAAQSTNIIIPVDAIKQRVAIGGKPTPLGPSLMDTPGTLSGSLYIKGILALLESGKTPEGQKKTAFALTMFQQAVDQRKDYVDAFFYIGYCQSELGKYQDATKSFKQALQIKPDHPEAHFGLGVACVNLGWNQEAVESFKEAIRVKPDYADAHYNLGLAYVNLGWTKEAVESFKEAVRINPDYAEAHYNIGVAYVQLGRNQDAIDSFKQAIRINPEQHQAHFGLGVAYSNLGRDQESADAFKEAIRLNPDYAEAHFGLGIAELNMNKYREASDSFKEAIRVKPDDAEAHYNLGLAYDKLANKAEATESYKQAVRLKPDYAEAHYSLAVIYIGEQDRGRALDEYKALKDLNADLAAKVFKLIYP